MLFHLRSTGTLRHSTIKFGRREQHSGIFRSSTYVQSVAFRHMASNCFRLSCFPFAFHIEDPTDVFDLKINNSLYRKKKSRKKTADKLLLFRCRMRNRIFQYSVVDREVPALGRSSLSTIIRLHKSHQHRPERKLPSLRPPGQVPQITASRSYEIRPFKNASDRNGSIFRTHRTAILFIG